jgi:hypothetical protein
VSDVARIRDVFSFKRRDRVISSLIQRGERPGGGARISTV